MSGSYNAGPGSDNAGPRSEDAGPETLMYGMCPVSNSA